MTERRSPLDGALDLTVYAPLGFVLERRRVVTELADRGRRQIAFARMIGRTAFSSTINDLRTAFEQASTPGAEAVPEARELVSADRIAEQAPATDETDEPAADAPDVASLAIPDYDSLAAKQVVKRLSGLTTGELEAVRLYESSHRGRRTVLGRIDQLQS